ncbi:MAG: DUF2905 domain-containing protein [Candidatus Omnitrophica bacterium]|nr:DUF2905 domain-containing protein [Candidatus Omnitrophota bacterium]
MVNEFAKTLIFFGVVLVIVGILVGIFGKIPGLGKLPGDIYLKKGTFTFYFPLTTCLLLSLLLTLVFTIFGKR